MAALPEDLKQKILQKPLYRQPDLKTIIPASASAFEQGRCGKGALAGLRFSRLGRMIVYSAADIIAFLESLPSYENTTAADCAKQLATRHSAA